MIQSGSRRGGVDPATFGLPPDTAIRYERPDPRLADLLPSYAVTDSDPAVWKGQGTWKLPGSHQLWIVLAEPISVKVRGRSYAPLGRAVVYGSTSRAMPLTTNGGPSILVDVSPRGWARWFDTPADGLRDQVMPLERLWPAERVQALLAAVAPLDDGTGIKRALDGFFLRRLPPPHRQEPLIGAVTTLLVEGVDGRSDATAGLDEQQLRRLTNRHFGFGPKIIFRRTRLLRALSAMMTAWEAPDHSATPAGYASLAHFHRDANDFLGCTARRFLAYPIDYQRAMMRARTAVIGAPVPALDGVGEAPR